MPGFNDRIGSPSHGRCVPPPAGSYRSHDDAGGHRSKTAFLDFRETLKHIVSEEIATRPGKPKWQLWNGGLRIVFAHSVRFFVMTQSPDIKPS